MVNWKALGKAILATMICLVAVVSYFLLAAVICVLLHVRATDPAAGTAFVIVFSTEIAVTVMIHSFYKKFTRIPGWA
jgi:hypothetical protein